MTNVVLIGAGGHSKVIQDIVNAHDDLTLHAILDQSIEQKEFVEGVIYAHTDMIESLVDDCKFCIAIGNNKVRQKLIGEFNIPLEKYIALIHPTAIISPSAAIGRGTVVMPHAVINADTVIGNHSIINSGAVIEHDNRLRDFVHISPNATLAGTVTVGEGTHVGAGAIVIPEKEIGSWSVVGAGAVVVSDVGDKVSVVGVPAKEMNKGNK
ncbi:acetyltransferase EpsM [Virgibacillus halotolerans]|uniref:NeuD/PglB/VioB family sugar acetyltransferase n=1 Tax=Virgibacillus halotolerans TaxID=1071053 RepID=UPI0019603B40|nr:NeuD/PglB/VioB family sugar acetyltransferase [Virgibacillus halotolerans]MBM7599921.1 acetyltransferase EpsM [Virgibacillus halotolerans]